jgi:hypothetical protein
MSNEIQKKLDEIRNSSKLHSLNQTNANRVLANINKANDKDYRKNLSNGKKGVKRPDMIGTNNPAYAPGVREAKIARLKGVPKSKDQIEKYKQSYKNLPMIVCPHCKFESKNQGNMNRYHFDNCKHKGENK